VGPQIAEDLPVSAADDEPDGGHQGGRAGVDVADGNAHGLGDPVVQRSRLKLVRDPPAGEHLPGHAPGDRLEHHTPGVDDPAPLPVTGVKGFRLCHVRLPPATLPACRP